MSDRERILERVLRIAEGVRARVRETRGRNGAGCLVELATLELLVDVLEEVRCLLEGEPPEE